MSKSKKDETIFKIVMIALFLVFVGIVYSYVKAHIGELLGSLAVMGVLLYIFHRASAQWPVVGRWYGRLVNGGAETYKGIRKFHRNVQKLDKQSSSSSKVTPEDLRKIQQLKDAGLW